MPAVTIDPSVEACQALVTRINAGTAYTLPAAATYSENLIDVLEEITGLRVDVCCLDSWDLDETLNTENRTSHEIHVWIRTPAQTQIEIDAAKTLTRKIFQQVNNFDSANKRVRVWECDYEKIENPSKETLRNSGLFVSQIVLRVEVEPPA